jgi:mannan endo-1,4-beta-mannosidase
MKTVILIALFLLTEILNVTASPVRPELLIIKPTITKMAAIIWNKASPLKVLSDTGAVYAGSPPTSIMVDPHASPLTRILYDNLKQLEGKHILFGQQDATSSGYGWRDTSGRCDVKDVTGAYPAVYSWDLMDFTLPGLDTVAGLKKIRKLTIEAYERGAVNSYCWHLFNLITGKNFYDTMRVVSRIIPGGDYNNKYKYELRKAAGYFGSLKGKHGELIPVIFRPFHEMDGNWFWWGNKFCSREEYKQLYKFTVEYLRDSLQVHNLIYAYSPDCKFSSEQQYLEHYPGDGYVDLLGMDNYWDFRFDGGNLDTAHKKLMIISNCAIRKNKLAALTETGQSNIPDSVWFTNKLLGALLGYPDKPVLSYVAVWRNSVKGFYTPYKGHPAEKDFIKMKGNPYLLFEDRLPKLYRKSKAVKN